MTDPDNSIRFDDRNGEILPQNSLFDGVFILNSTNEEANRRASNRKVDPTTNTVYHLEDSPPPEGDAKLIERLQEYFSPFPSSQEMLSKLRKNHAYFEAHEPSLLSFFQNFGQLDLFTLDGLHTLNSMNQQAKDPALQAIWTQVRKIISFKQAEMDRKYESLKEKVAREDELKKEEEVAAHAS